MKALFKLGLGLVGLVVVVVVAAAFIVGTLDPNEHKDWITDQAMDQTGRELQLNGDIALTYYPWFGIEANQVVLGNAEGFAEQAFFKADHLKLRIKLVPLLKERYEIDTVIVKGAEINLAKNKEGVSNWQDLVSGEADQDKGALPLAAVVLGGVDIQSASFSWDDQSTETLYRATDVNVLTDALTYGEPIKVTVDMDLFSQKPAIAGSVNMKGTIAYDIDNEQYSLSPLELNALIKSQNIPGGETQVKLSTAIDIDLDEDTATVSDLNLTGLDTIVTGTINSSRVTTAEPSVQAGLSVKGKDLALLFKLAEIDELASEVAKLANRQFSLDTSIDADMERGDVHISGLSLAMLGATVKGDVKTTNILSETPGYKGKLNAAGPDLPTLLKVLGQFSGGKDSALTQYGLILADNKHKSFKIDADFDADMKSGDVDVPKLVLNMLGASVNGEVRASNILSETPGYHGILKAKGPDLPTLLQVIGQAQGGSESALSVYGKKLRKLKQKSFSIDAGFDADMKSGDVQVPTLKVDTLGVKVSGNLNAKNIHADNGLVSGKLDISGDELGPLLKALEQPALADSLKSLELQTTISGNADKVALKPLELKARVSSEQTGKQLVALRADTTLNLPRQTLVMDGIKFRGMGLDITGNVNATKIMEQPQVKGTLDVAPFKLRDLMKRLKQEVPKTSDKKVLRQAALNTQFKASAKNLELDKLVMQLDDTKLTGSFAMNNLEKSAYDFDLNIDRINFDRYMEPTAKGDSKAPVTPETVAGAAVQLPIKTLRGLNAKGKLSVGQLVVSKARMSKVNLNLDSKDGRIKLSPISAKLYGGAYNGNIDINAKGKIPKVVIDSSIKGVQIEPLLMDTQGEAVLVGRSDISIAVVGRGNDTEFLRKTLAGQAELKVTNGVFRGVDVRSALEQVEIMIESKQFGRKVNTEGNTPFDSLRATMPISKGIVTNEDLVLKAPGFVVTGKGMLANLRNMTWKYDMKIGVDERSVARGEKTYNIGDYSIPIKCRGAISGDNCTPDKMSFASRAVKKILLDKIAVPGGGNTDQTNATDKNADPSKELIDKALKSIFK